MTKLTFDEYQRRAMETAIYPREYAVMYPALGLAGEAGEVCEKIKKAIRDHGGEFDREALKKEIGDVLWYCAILAGDIGYSLSRAVGRERFEQWALRWPVPGEALPFMALHIGAQVGNIAQYVFTSKSYAEKLKNKAIAAEILCVMLLLNDIASALDTSLEDIARANLAKLADRAERGTIRGEGDDR